ncbi:hypothetical protein T484DRAFT_1756015 [Baffinella frigidus]|nr:hypothetical protein T484DRAFT_1756015 [Cryptophyta sp. CCMP2293]
MRTGMHPSPSSPPLAAAGPREGSATRLSPIEGDGRQLSVPRLSGGGGSGSRNGVASTLRARLDQQLAIRMDQTWASGPDALGSPTFSPSADERAEELSILKKELAESYSAIAGESYLCLSLETQIDLRERVAAPPSPPGNLRNPGGHLRNPGGMSESPENWRRGTPKRGVVVAEKAPRLSLVQEMRLGLSEERRRNATLAAQVASRCEHPKP